MKKSVSNDGEKTNNTSIGTELEKILAPVANLKGDTEFKIFLGQKEIKNLLGLRLVVTQSADKKKASA